MRQREREYVSSPIVKLKVKFETMFVTETKLWAILGVINPLLFFFFWYATAPHINTAFNNYSIVAWEACLQTRCLAMTVFLRCTCPPFRRQVTLYSRFDGKGTRIRKEPDALKCLLKINIRLPLVVWHATVATAEKKVAFQVSQVSRSTNGNLAYIDTNC
jgi:hypothetical protein